MSKVQFVGDKGKVFFECHPAEVRVAIDAIEDYRKLGYVIPSEEKKAAAFVPDILKEPVFKDMGTVDRPIEELFSQMFEIIEKKDLLTTHIIMNAKGYANLRRADRSMLEMETRSSVLQSCKKFAHLWTARIYIDNTLPDNKVYVASAEDNVKITVVMADHVDTNAHVDLLNFLKDMGTLVGKAIRAVKRMK